jgi:hypothetical protein
MTKLPAAWIRLVKSLANGANDSTRKGSKVCKISHAGDAPVLFPPAVIVEIKALACELPRELKIPLSRLSLSELRHEAISRGIVAQISGTTLWRWLAEDAIKPWRYRSWIFPRDPAFTEKASRVLSL